MLMEDFNALLEAFEKSSGLLKEDRSTVDSRNFVRQNSLIDKGYRGAPFTWCNMQHGAARRWERMDQVVGINFRVDCNFFNIYL